MPPLRAYIRPAPWGLGREVLCGRRDCGTRVTDPDDPGRLRLGFTRSDSAPAGVEHWELSRRAQAQWDRARRQGVPWARWALRPRRPDRSGRIPAAQSLAALSRWRQQRADADAEDETRTPALAWSFRCPVCGLISVVAD